MKLPIYLVLFITSATVYAGDIGALVQFCEHCHGKGGNSTTSDVPTIAGFSYDGFLNTMEVFRDNDRIAVKFQKPGEPETVMNDIARSLSDENVENLAQYFSKQEFKPIQQNVNPDLAQRGEIIHKKSCNKCHSGNGADPVEDAAILAGQWTPYLRRQFDNFLSGKRWAPKTMLRRIKKLSKQDIESLLNFYAREGMQ